MRLRQAFSMAMDRDLYLDTWANVSKFKEDGLEVETKWNTAAGPADYKGWYLDPQSKEFGENGQVLQAQHRRGEEADGSRGVRERRQPWTRTRSAGTNYGLNYAPQIEVLEGMAAEVGLQVQTKAVPGASAAGTPTIRDSRGFFEGIAFRLTPVPAEPGEGLYALYNKDGSFNYGFDAEGKGVASLQGPFHGDATADDLTKQDAHGVRRREAHPVRARAAEVPGQAAVFPPCARRRDRLQRGLAGSAELRVCSTASSWGYLWKRYWIDSTKAPLA